MSLVNKIIGKKLLLFADAGLKFLVNGSWDNTILSAPVKGMFLAIDNLNFSAFGTTSYFALYDGAAGLANIEYGIDVDSGGNVDIIENGAVVATTVMTLSTGTDYDLVIALDNDKIAHYFIRAASDDFAREFVGTFVTSASTVHAEDDNTGATYTTNVERFGLGMPYEVPAVDMASIVNGDGSVAGGDPQFADGDFSARGVLTTAPVAAELFKIDVRVNGSTYFQLRKSATAYTLYENGSTLRATGAATPTDADTFFFEGTDSTFTLFVNGVEDLTYASALANIRSQDWRVVATGGAVSSWQVWKGFPHNAGLGSELIVNGDFADWTADDPDGWTIEDETGATQEVSEVGTGEGHGGSGTGLANIFTSSSNFKPGMSQAIMTIGNYYRIVFDLDTRIGGFVQLFDGSTLLEEYFTVGTKTFDIVTAGTTVRWRAKAVGSDVTFDNASVKEIQFTPDALGSKLNEAVT